MYRTGTSPATRSASWLRSRATGSRPAAGRNSPSEPRCGQTYPGPTAASEPEITALETLVRSLFADQRGPADNDPAPLTATGVFLTLHSYSNLVLWPWGWTSQTSPNNTSFTYMGTKLASYNGFTPEQSLEDAVKTAL